MAVLGACPTLTGAAVTAAVERVLTTELGHESPYSSRHIDTLERDAERCGAPHFTSQMRGAIAEATAHHRRQPPHGAAAFFEAQHVIGEAMLDVASFARQRDELRPLEMNTIWRLGQLADQIGEVADGIGAGWPRMNNVSAEDLRRIERRIETTRGNVRRTSRGGDAPFAERLLDRAEEQLEIVRASGGQQRGAWWAAAHLTRTAHSLTGVERPVLRRVFAVGEFETSTIVTKGMLFRPGKEHLVGVRIFNFLDREVEGSIRPSVPEGWSVNREETSFRVAPGDFTEPIAIRFGVPGEPVPWVQRPLSRPEWPEIEVDAPREVPLVERLSLTLQGTGAPESTMGYRMLVGAFPANGLAGPTDALVHRLPVLEPRDAPLVAPGSISRPIGVSRR